MKVIIRHEYWSPPNPKGRTKSELLTAEEAAEKHPGWTPDDWSRRVERIPEPDDPPEPERHFGMSSPPMPGSYDWKRLHPDE